jgi:hypothetical protein
MNSLPLKLSRIKDTVKSQKKTNETNLNKNEYFDTPPKRLIAENTSPPHTGEAIGKIPTRLNQIENTNLNNIPNKNAAPAALKPSLFSKIWDGVKTVARGIKTATKVFLAQIPISASVGAIMAATYFLGYCNPITALIITGIGLIAGTTLSICAKCGCFGGEYRNSWKFFKMALLTPFVILYACIA